MLTALTQATIANECSCGETYVRGLGTLHFSPPGHGSADRGADRQRRCRANRWVSGPLRHEYPRCGIRETADDDGNAIDEERSVSSPWGGGLSFLVTAPSPDRPDQVAAAGRN